MENASKALIIAGAILLAILLITAGIVVIRAIDPVSQQAKDSAETMAIESYNAQFIKYEGEKMSGAQVKSLISTARSSNAVHEREMIISYGGELESEKDIRPNGKYDVTITEWSDGYIKAMTVSGVKGLTVVPPIVPGDETPVNNSPTVTAIVENITTTTAKIVATGTDADEGDTLTYNFYILNTEKNKEGTTDETWKVTGLDSNTKYDYKVEVTDGKITKGTTGTFTTLEETPINNVPTINPTVTNIETNSVTINADGKDIDGDTLTYVLYIAGNKYGESQTGKWDVTGLNSNTSYEYKVTVTDGKISNPVEKRGQFTTKKENTAPTLTVTIKDSNIYCTKARMSVIGTDADGDDLTYTLLINGVEQRKGTSNIWDLEELTKNTTYNYEVIVEDGKGGIATKSGTFKTDNIIVEISEATDITTNSATITITATSDKGHELLYYIGNEKDTDELDNYRNYEAGTNNIITAEKNYKKYTFEDLDSNTKYYYCTYVVYNGGGDENAGKFYSNIKEFGTNCPGDTYYCSGGYSSQCTSGTYCVGYKMIPCTGTPAVTKTNAWYDTCGACGYNTYCDREFKCSVCGMTGYSRGCLRSECSVGTTNTNNHANSKIKVNCDHGYSSAHYIHSGCGCNNGYFYNSCTHNKYYAHNYCSHNINGVEHTYAE